MSSPKHVLGSSSADPSPSCNRRSKEPSHSQHRTNNRDHYLCVPHSPSTSAHLNNQSAHSLEQSSSARACVSLNTNSPQMQQQRNNHIVYRQAHEISRGCSNRHSSASASIHHHQHHNRQSTAAPPSANILAKTLPRTGSPSVQQHFLDVQSTSGTHHSQTRPSPQHYRPYAHTNTDDLYNNGNGPHSESHCHSVSACVSLSSPRLHQNHQHVNAMVTQCSLIYCSKRHSDAAFSFTDSLTTSTSSTNSSGDSGSAGTSKSHSLKQTHHVQLGKRVENFFTNDTLCDVTLVAADDANVRIRAHKLILAAASQYFCTMFTCGMSETHENEVTMHQIDAHALTTLITFCYSGQVRLEEQTVESVMSGACLLQLDEVVDCCTDFLSGQLHTSNCLGIRAFAQSLGNCHRLAQMAHEYAMEHFPAVLEQREFVQLSVDDVHQFLVSDHVNVPSEMAVLYALTKWIQYDLADRTKHAYSLLQCVRLNYVPAETIVDQVECHPLFLTGACQRLIMNAVKHHLMPARRTERMLSNWRLSSTEHASPVNVTESTSSLCPSLSSCPLSPRNEPELRPRPSTVGTMFCIGGSDANKGALFIEQYDYRRDAWHIVARMRSRRLQFGSAVIDGLVYVAGGRDGLKTLSSFECWNPMSSDWKTMPAMMTPRHGLSVAVLEGPLYACGGHDGWAYLSSVERWDPATQTWTYVAEMNRARNTAGVAVLGGKLYCIGGRDSSAVLRCVECFNPHTNTWQLVAPMNRRRSGVGVAVLDGCIYAVGGMDAPSSNPQSARFACVERYDPRTDTWCLVASLSLGRDGVGVCALGDRLFAVGGCHNGHAYVPLVECYDAQANLWTQVSSLHTARAGTQVLVVPNKAHNYVLALPSGPATNEHSHNDPLATAYISDEDDNEQHADWLKRNTIMTPTCGHTGKLVVRCTTPAEQATKQSHSL